MLLTGVRSRNAMKVALPIWNSRISPVFDTAERMLIVDIQGDSVTGSEEYQIHNVFPPLRSRELRDVGVDVLICGAISNPLAGMIDDAGIRLLPWVSGEVDEVLDAFRRGQLTDSRYFMPGCRGRRRRARRRRL
jgi:predicted Fe-Mo cluster-binding NifX family protein